MERTSQLANRAVRLVALLTLALGLTQAGRLLGVWSTGADPLGELGVAGFVYLAIFALGMLFAAVGLWIGTSWGAVLLVGTLVVELGLYMSGNPDVSMTIPGFCLRLGLLVAMLLVFLAGVRLRRLSAHD